MKDTEMEGRERGGAFCKLVLILKRGLSVMLF